MLSIEGCFQLVAAAVRQAKADLVESDPGDKEFDSALFFLSNSQLLQAALVSTNVEPEDVVKAVISQVNAGRARRNKPPVVVA